MSELKKNDKFIVGNYYLIKHPTDGVYCFKFEKVEGYSIYSYNFQFFKFNNRFIYQKLSHPFCDINWFKQSNTVEINIKEIVEYLPNEHPDKKNYYRKQKIKYLLNETR